MLEILHDTVLNLLTHWHVNRPHRNEANAESAASIFASADGQSSNQRPMYCKDKIYTGGREYSFEELRAWSWQAKRSEREQREAQYSQMRADIMYESTYLLTCRYVKKLVFLPLKYFMKYFKVFKKIFHTATVC